MNTSTTSQEHSSHTCRYQHAIIEGTSYEAGRLQGRFLQQAGRTLISYDPPEPEKTSREMQRLYEQYCPGLNDEIRGVADYLGLPFEKALFCACIGPANHHCSQVAILPAITQEGHQYVARSYEMGIGEADLRLCTTRVNGKAAHLGFSEMLVGRNDGINSHGLCVTMSVSWDPVPGESTEPHGLHFAMAIRALLDSCRNLQEALDLLQCIPIAGGVNIIVAHQAGEAALVEIAGRKRTISYNCSAP